MAIIHGEKRRLGFFGERKAAKFLKRKGYEIRERNFRSKLGEVDIIAKLGEVVAFVEVKTRRTHTYGEPNEAVDDERQGRYRRAANFYFYKNGLSVYDFTVRFDVIEVTKRGINHIENAF